jgi:hypothetical protein
MPTELDIAILGWGSLVWDPRELQHDGRWRRGGPVLPLEFSRRSSGGRLTLVVDREHGTGCQVRYSNSPRTDLDQAVADLAARETTAAHWIGFVEPATGRCRGRDGDAVASIRSWCASRGFDAAIWTDLPGNFAELTGRTFSVGAAIDHLRGLDDPDRTTAATYLDRAPEEVVTPLRRAWRAEVLDESVS